MKQPVHRIRVGPALEAWVAENFDAALVIIDHTMEPDRIEVTPLAYAEHIECTIGFAVEPTT